MSDIFISIEDKSIILLFEELFSFFFGNTLGNTHSVGASSSLRDSLAGFLKDNIEVHTENTGVGIIFDTKVNVFLNTEAEVTGVGEVTFSKFEFFDFKSFFQDFFGLFSSDGDMEGNLFISLNTERTDGVSGFGGNWSLSSQIFQHLDYRLTF
jgi:hypothetical protein